MLLEDSAPGNIRIKTSSHRMCNVSHVPGPGPGSTHTLFQVPIKTLTVLGWFRFTEVPEQRSSPVCAPRSVFAATQFPPVDGRK